MTGTKSYIIRHSRYKNENLGTIILDFDNDTCKIFMPDSYEGLHPGFLLEGWHGKGMRVIEGELADYWLRKRVCPPGRHNIDEILMNYGLEKYNGAAIIAKNEGYCDWDDLWFEEIV